MEAARESTFFPLFLDLSDRRVLFVGGGRIATRRVAAMEPYAPNLAVVAPEASGEIVALARAGRLVWMERSWDDSLLGGADIVLACTDDHALNEHIRALCRERGILVNICSAHEQCDFHFPGIVRRGNVTVAVNAAGKDHARAKELRMRIQEMLEEDGE